MVSNTNPQESDSSQSVSDSGCSYSRLPSQAQEQQQHELSHDLPSSGAGTFQKLDLGDGSASPGGENLGFRDKKRQRSLSPLAEHQLQQRDQDQRGSEQDKAVPVSASASASALQSVDAAVNMEAAVQHAWWLPAAGTHQGQNQSPGGFKVPHSLAAQQQAPSSQVIRPTSIPHEKSLFLRSDSGDMHQGFGMMKFSEGVPHHVNAGDVNMVDGSTSGNSRLIGRIADLGAAVTGDPSSSGRKSFVEWRPMVVPEGSITTTSSFLLRPSFSSSSQLSPVGMWPPPPPVPTTSTVTSLSYFNQALGFNNAAVRPNINFPPIPTFPPALMSHHSQGAGATTNQDWLRSSSIATQFHTLSNLQGAGEQRQLLFLGPTDRDRPLSGNQQQQREAIPVVMEGSSITASMCLQDYDSYARFAAAIKSIFSQDKSVDLSEEGCNLTNAVPEHIIAYEDRDGDLLLAGDLSWRKFVRTAKRIRILPAKGRCVAAVP